MRLPAANEQTALIIITLNYIAIVMIFAWSMSRRADRLLKHVSDSVPETLWEELGAPDSIQAAVKDPERRWAQFIRGEIYRNKCHPDLVARIDNFKMLTNRGLILLGITGAGIVYFFWSQLKPDFL